MPKLGRKDWDRNDSTSTNYLFGSGAVTGNAPFGNTETPSLRVKIIGSKPKTVRETATFEHPENYEPMETARSSFQVSPRKRGKNNKHFLSALTEKPNNFDPTPFLRGKKNRYGYTSAQQDSFESHIHLPTTTEEETPRRGRRTLNPHAVIPPINTQKPTVKDTVNNNTQNNTEEDFPQDNSSSPVALSQLQESELRSCLLEELDGFKVSKLKDVYLEMTGFDKGMTGYVKYEDLGFAILRGQMHITPQTLRFLATKFLSPTDPDRVNYEQLLSYIAKVLNNNPIVESPAPRYEPPPAPAIQRQVSPPKRNNRTSQENRNLPEHYFNPITHQEEDYSPRSSKFPYQDRDNSKLLRYIEQQLIESEQPLDFEKIWSSFREADRAQRGKLSRQQIRDLTMQCRIPLQASIVDQIVSKCECSNGQYDWQQYLEFIERVQPLQTGLTIPNSKKPVEFARHYPTPSENWPKEGNDTSRSYYERSQPGDYGKEQQILSKTEESKAERLGSLTADEEIARLEHMRNKLIEEKRKQQSSESWFERFMKLAENLYNADSESTGRLPVSQAVDLLKRSNVSQQLDLSDTDLEHAVESCRAGHIVNIDPLLKVLAVKGP